jgi:hypothetical protein
LVFWVYYYVASKMAANVSEEPVVSILEDGLENHNLNIQCSENLTSHKYYFTSPKPLEGRGKGQCCYYLVFLEVGSLWPCQDQDHTVLDDRVIIEYGAAGVRIGKGSKSTQTPPPQCHYVHYKSFIT